jgi:predicted enzyme related to lactoylglutathione lyase
MAKKTGYEHGQFSWVDLSSHGMAGAKQFYGSLFGWQADDQDTQGGPPYSIFKLEGKQAAGLGELSAEMRSQGIPPMWNSYINVDDIEATVKKAQELGATVTVPVIKVPDAGRLAYIQDPTGAHVAFWQKDKHFGAEVCNEPGSFCWNELLTRDMEKAKAFYGDLIGWTYEKHEPSPTDYYLIQAKSGMNGGIMKMTEEFGDAPPHWSVYFAVSDTDAIAKRVAELGGGVTVPPFDTPVGKIAVLADPQGAHFSVISMKADPQS